MHANRSSIWLKQLVTLVLFAASTASAASAQTSRPAPALEAAVEPGMTVWITDTSGREDKARIVGVSAGTLTAAADGETLRFRTADVVRVRARRSDSLVNGALIGAGAAIATGLAVCRLTEPWENCRDDVGPMVRIGALGAGIGIAVDALIRGRKTIYEAGSGSPRVQAAPIVARRGAGLQLSIRF